MMKLGGLKIPLSPADERLRQRQRRPEFLRDVVLRTGDPLAGRERAPQHRNRVGITGLAHVEQAQARECLAIGWVGRRAGPLERRDPLEMCGFGRRGGGSLG